jgi:hypothetical protein
VTPLVTANVNIHAKMLVVPVPEKFNTFNTFNTFDSVATWRRTKQSAGGNTARRVEKSRSRAVEMSRRRRQDWDGKDQA